MHQNKFRYKNDSTFFFACGRRTLRGLVVRRLHAEIVSALRELLRLGILDAEGLDRDGLHALVGFGLVVHHVARGAGDLVHDLDALDDLAEGGVLAVKVRRILMHDEKLAAGAVGDHGARHGEHAARVLQIVLEAVGAKLALDAVARAADADTVRVAALDHEAGDDAVEDHAVIKALLHETDEVVDGVRGNVGIELSLDDAAVFHFDGDDGIAHSIGSFLSFNTVP